MGLKWRMRHPVADHSAIAAILGPDTRRALLQGASRAHSVTPRTSQNRNPIRYIEGLG